MRGPGFSVRNRTLLAIAGSVWLAAGGNVARIGGQAYRGLPRVGAVHLLLSLVVFGLFGSMFFRMSQKHTRRIRGYAGETQPFWRFFDRKAYLIMAVMMTGGIGLQASGLASERFIAVFLFQTRGVPASCWVIVRPELCKGTVFFCCSSK